MNRSYTAILWVILAFSPVWDLSQEAQAQFGRSSNSVDPVADARNDLAEELKAVAPPEEKPSVLGAEAKIEESLREKTRLDFIETPLSDVQAFLADMHRLNIKIDTKALDDAGQGSDVPITAHVQGITLQSALNLMLKDLELTYVVENEVLLITSEERADETKCVRLYPIAEFLAAGWSLESLKKVIQSETSVEAEQLGDFLAIAQSQPAHRRTAELMQRLAAAVKQE